MPTIRDLWARRVLAVVATAAMTAALGACAGSGAKQVVSNTGPTPRNTSSTVATSTTETTVPETTTVEPTTVASTTTTVAKVVPAKSPAVFVSAPLAVPVGRPGVLDVVMVGKAGDASTVPVVVRNNTNEVLTSMSVSGIARNGGALIGSGDSQGFAPAVVNPGEWAFGYVYYSSKIPNSATFDLTASGDPLEDAYFKPIDLTIAEVNSVRGSFGPTIVGIAKNTSNDAVSWPTPVDLLCFSGTTLLKAQQGFLEGKSALAPGATGSFAIDLFDSTCPSFAVAAPGRAAS